MSSCSRSLADHIFRLLYSLFLVDERRASERADFIPLLVETRTDWDEISKNQLIVKAGWRRETLNKEKKKNNVRHPGRSRSNVRVRVTVDRYFGSILKCLTFSICCFFSDFSLFFFFFFLCWTSCTLAIIRIINRGTIKRCLRWAVFDRLIKIWIYSIRK